MNIVVLDGYTENPGDLSWEPLKKFGELRIYDRTPCNDSQEIIRRIGDASIVITNKTPITSEIMDASRIRYISVLATGYNIIDVAYAHKKGITVSNVPTYGTAAVAQFAIGLLLEICHRIGYHDFRVHNGAWQACPDWCFWDYPLIELDGKTLGVIGFGRIGRATGKIAAALDMKVLAYDKYQDEQGALIAEYVSLDDLITRSDVIALHCPLFPETKEIINAETISRMKKGVIIINNSRGALINEKDLADALKAGKVAAAGVDVVSTEPISSDNPLLTAPNCFITPHISWAPKESRQRIMDCTIRNIDSFLKGMPINTI